MKKFKFSPSVHQILSVYISTRDLFFMNLANLAPFLPSSKGNLLFHVKNQVKKKKKSSTQWKFFLSWVNAPCYNYWSISSTFECVMSQLSWIYVILWFSISINYFMHNLIWWSIRNRIFFSNFKYTLRRWIWMYDFGPLF